MRTVVHVSDLHFGAADPAIVHVLLETIARIGPQVVAVSGDLTQRARRQQFQEARAFLDALPYPQIIVPGNHDVPLFNVVARFLNPLGGYRRRVTRDLRPLHVDDELAVVGLNTTRSLTIKGGAIRDADVEWVCDTLHRLGDHLVKVVVSHHPFDQLDRRQNRAGSMLAIEALVRGGADVFLTGHLHASYAGHTTTRYSVAGRSAIVVEASTATSTRVRGEANGFNVLRVERSNIVVEHFEWQPLTQRFGLVATMAFSRTPGGWAGTEPAARDGVDSL